MRPIRGTGNVSNAANIRAAAFASRTLSSCVYSSALAIHAMSAPAENTLPAPAITVTRTSSSALIAAAHAVNSAIICSLNALRTSGRFSVRYSTTSSRRVRRVSYDINSNREGREDHEVKNITLLRALRVLRGSHPEDPELRRPNG